MTNAAVIDANGLSRTFGDYRAVSALDLHVERGEVFGLLGPNGAGKTTTISMLTTLLSPTSGTARVCGFDIGREASAIRRRIGYVMQKIPYRGPLTGRECVEIEASLYHVPRREVRRRAAEMLDLVGLTTHADKRWTTYSGGMQKRLDLACGLLHRPELLVLDEPSLGLDVQSRHNIWEHVRTLADSGVTVLLATNYLDEADRLCDRLTIIDQGREVVTGSPAELKRGVSADLVDVHTSDAARFQAAIAGAPWVREVRPADDGGLHVYVDEASVALPAIMRTCTDAGVELQRLGYSQPSLDDVFLMHTGRELRDEGAAA